MNVFLWNNWNNDESNKKKWHVLCSSVHACSLFKISMFSLITCNTSWINAFFSMCNIIFQPHPQLTLFQSTYLLYVKKKNKKYFNWKTDRKNKNEEEEVKKNPIIKWHVFNLSISLIKSILATNTHNICRWFFFIAFMLITKIDPTFCHGYYK